MTYTEWKEQKARVRAQLTRSDRVLASSKAARSGLAAVPAGADLGDEPVTAFTTFADVAIRKARESGWSDALILQGVANRLRVEIPGPPWTVDKDGNAAERPAPPGFEPKNPNAGAGEAIAEWVKTLKRFSARRRAGRIPHAEYESALPQGSAAWRKLVVKWGAETAPDEGQGVGQFFPGDPRGVA